MTLILQASTEHLPQAARLLSAQLTEHDITLAPDALASALRGLIEHPSRGAVFLAWEGDEAIGLACLSALWTLEHGGASMWLDELYVSPEHRGRGVGRALLLHAMAYARNTGCIALDLEVDEEHARAANLYEREGFRRHRRARFVKFL